MNSVKIMRLIILWYQLQFLSLLVEVLILFFPIDLDNLIALHLLFYLALLLFLLLKHFQHPK